MPPKTRREDDAPVDPNKLKRETAGRYVTADGRFIVEQGSGGWMIVDGEQTNELGLPLVRGPFATLDEARAGLEGARSGEAPTSQLAERIAELKDRAATETPRQSKDGRARRSKVAEEGAAESQPAEPPEAKIRVFRRGDGDDLRRLWDEVGFRSVGDDDAGLRRFAERNPDLLLVATAAGKIVGSALGGWDGRRGWIYHVATTAEQRRSGLGTRLVREVEDRLRKLGAPKVNVIVRDDNPAAVLFWESAGYERAPTRQFSRELGD